MNNKKNNINIKIEPYINEDGYYPQCPTCGYFDLIKFEDCPSCKQKIDWDWLKLYIDKNK